jgi:hypothetical protein
MAWVGSKVKYVMHTLIMFWEGTERLQLTQIVCCSGLLSRR